MNGESHIGFTGSQAGMTMYQKQFLRGWLASIPDLVFHHGDCTGADAEAHEIALEVGARVVIHPPEKELKRAFCVGAHEVRPPRPYMVRNHDIVNGSHMLIAAPDGPERLRSGTWATVRYARKQYVPWVCLDPQPEVDTVAYTGDTVADQRRRICGQTTGSATRRGPDPGGDRGADRGQPDDGPNLDPPVPGLP